MRIWYTKEVETNAAHTERTDFGNKICDLHMGYDWYLGRGHNPITVDNLHDTHDFAVSDMWNFVASDDLEAIFVMFQGENMSEHLRKLLYNRGMSHTSMSVGDIIETNDGVLHFVDGCGFVTLEGK